MSQRLSITVTPAWSVVSNRLRVDSLLRNSVYVMTSTALTAASGYLFWIIAAHMYPAHDVGLASALIGTMMLASTLANLGIGPTLIQVLPRRQSGEDWSLTLNAVFFTGILSSLFVGCIAALVLPFVAPNFAREANSGIYSLVVIAGVPMLALAALLDSTFTAERAAGNVLARTAAFALLRVPLLVLPIALGVAGAFVIGTAWILAAGGSIICGALLVPRLRRSYRVTWHGIRGQMRAMLSLVAGHQFISLGALAPIYLMPLFVVSRLSFAENAYFYTSWQVGSLFFMVSPSVATALLAEGSNTPENVVRKAKSSLLIIGGLLCPAMLVAFLGGHLILSMFGASYSQYGYTLLTVLVISAVPDAITNVYVSVLRVRKQFALASGLNLGMAAIALVLAWFFLPQMGIVGAGWAWLIAQTAGTLAVGAHIAIVHVRTRAAHWRSLWPARAAVERILLIVDPCSAGEALRLAPYFSMVRRQHPHAHITLVANADALQGFERVDDLDRVVKSRLYIHRPYSRIRARASQALHWLGLVRQVGSGYDLVVTFYWGGIFQHTLGYLAGRTGQRAGYSTLPHPLARVLLSNDLGPFDRLKSYPRQHAALLSAVAIETDDAAPPTLTCTEDDRMAVAHLLREHDLVGEDRLIVLHPGSDWACQQWLQERWAELADTLATRYHAAIIFTGSPNEAQYVEDIQQRMLMPSTSLVGQTTLPQVAALLSRGQLCVCLDVAVFELTQAVGIPTVVLAGPSRPDTGVFGSWQPTIVRRTNDALAAKIVACQDDHNARNERNCWNYQCEMAGLRQISVASVLKAVEGQMPKDIPMAPHEAEDTTLVETTPTLHPMLNATFSALNSEHINWCLLRGESDLHNPGDDDVDLLIAPDDLPRARAILEAQQYVRLPSMGRGSHTFYLGYHPQTETWITLDIVTELTYGPYLNMPTYAAAGCLTRRQSSGALYSLAADDGFWTLFLHCMLDKGRFAPHRGQRLRELVSAARTDGPLTRLATFACPRDWDAMRIVGCVQRGDWVTLTQLAPTLVLGWQRRAPARAWWRAAVNHAGQVIEIPAIRLRRPGISVALLGPDGAGKSTLVAEVREHSHFPVRTVYMGLWKSGPTKAWAKSPIPGARAASQGIEIAGRMPKAWGRYLTGRFHQALGRTVMFDRYVYDALTSSHQPMSLLKRTYMWVLGHSCPAPNLVVVLDVPGEVMFARKGEDSPEALEAQRQSLLALSGRVRNVHVVDNTRGVAAARSEVLNLIWTEYRRRWATHQSRAPQTLPVDGEEQGQEVLASIEPVEMAAAHR